MLAPVDAEAVQALIRERQEARKQRDYRTADDILSRLLDEHGVVLDDAKWSWRVVGSSHDGDYGEGGGYGRRASAARSQRKQHDYVREPFDRVELSAQETEQIDGLLARRMEFKMAREFQRADALQRELRDLGVEVDDRSRTWRMAYPEDGDGYGFEEY
jgi:cysteinyl-tRNA synthetase